MLCFFYHRLFLQDNGFRLTKDLVYVIASDEAADDDDDDDPHDNDAVYDIDNVQYSVEHGQPFSAKTLNHIDEPVLNKRRDLSVNDGTVNISAAHGDIKDKLVRNKDGEASTEQIDIGSLGNSCKFDECEITPTEFQMVNTECWDSD